ncbi:cupin domain-containing protein [Leifsonia poae]|uniref:cupin domain-containing protein n=1 Tax=Leifsonia poae TaxID=110933 RepID=UPI003D69E009
MTRKTLDDHRLDAVVPVRHVEVRRIEIAPGLHPGAHWHNGPVFGVIERGSVLFAVGDGPEWVLRPGDTFFEPGDRTIARFDATEEGVTFLAWFPLPESVSPELTMGSLPS